MTHTNNHCCVVRYYGRKKGDESDSELSVDSDASADDEEERDYRR